MNLSLLIKTLTAARKQFGDIPVYLIDGESGNKNPIVSVMRDHPRDYVRGGIKRNEPPNGIVLLDGKCYANDLEVKP